VCCHWNQPSVVLAEPYDEECRPEVLKCHHLNIVKLIAIIVEESSLQYIGSACMQSD